MLPNPNTTFIRVRTSASRHDPLLRARARELGAALVARGYGVVAGEAEPGLHLEVIAGAIGARGEVISVVPPSLWVGSSRVDLQACKLEYSIVSPK